MVEAVEAMPAMEGQPSLMSSDMRHELPTDAPHVRTSSLPHWHME